MNSNITFTPGEAWISDLSGNQIMFSDHCTIEEFVTPLSDKAELEHTINLSVLGNAEFTCENVQLNTSLLNSMLEVPKTPAKVYWDVPIMIQARWHKKYRVNKKWLKRYGMKRDVVAVEAEIKSIANVPGYAIPTDIAYYDSDNRDFELDIGMPVYKYRTSQTGRNRKIEYLR